MCFSAQASFGASLVLGTMGLYALHKAKQQERFLALVPMFFSIQQACEGVVWMTYGNPIHHVITTMATYGFCFFAFFFWPIWIPLTVLKMETNPQKRSLLQILLGLGAIVASILIFSVINTGIQTAVSCSHIEYDVFLPGILGHIGAFFYCVATILPLFIASKKWLSLFGFLTLVSVGITYFFYNTFFVSVWCFFAALLSGMIILML